MSFKENFINNGRNIKSWTDHNSPAILLGTGLCGIAALIFSMYHDAPECREELWRAKLLREGKKDLKEDTIIFFKNMWKDFLIAAGTATCFCMCYSKMNHRLDAAIALNAGNVELLKLYKNKIAEELGDKKAEEIKQEITKERINENSDISKEIIITNPGEFLCKDCHTGRYFAASRDQIMRAENALNRMVYSEMFVTLNQFYDEIDISHIKIGDEIGWTADNPPRFSMEFAELAEDGRPCMLVDYDLELRTAPW